MRERYFRRQTYASYFDSRLAWYPRAWVYKDSYAIKPAWPIFKEHPEWVLRDGRGRMLYIDWGCKDGRCLQYAADIGNPAFRHWWIEGARALAARGYIGIWIDDVNLTWRFSDGESDDVVARDPRTGRDMTLDDWPRYFADFMTELRAALPETEIAHNAIWYAGPADDPSITRQIEAADYVNLERGATDKGLCGAYNANILRATLRFMAERGHPVRLVTVGRRGRDFMGRHGGHVVAEYADLPPRPTLLDVPPIARTVLDDFRWARF